MSAQNSANPAKGKCKGKKKESSSAGKKECSIEPAFCKSAEQVGPSPEKPADKPEKKKDDCPKLIPKSADTEKKPQSAGPNKEKKECKKPNPKSAETERKAEAAPNPKPSDKAEDKKTEDSKDCPKLDPSKKKP